MAMSRRAAGRRNHRHQRPLRFTRGGQSAPVDPVSPIYVADDEEAIKAPGEELATLVLRRSSPPLKWCEPPCRNF